MIIFDLKCEPENHVFEAWFGSTEDYLSQQKRRLVSCPICGSETVAKAPMAPRVAPRGGRQGQSEGPPGEAEAMKAVLTALASVQREQLRNSDFVGDGFPDEARAIHLGEAKARSIHGRTSAEEAKKLVEEGIKVTPLLFPIVEPGLEN
jgi:hypothetical protein